MLTKYYSRSRGNRLRVLGHNGSSQTWKRCLTMLFMVMEGNYTQRMSLLLTLPLRWSLKPNWSWRQLVYFAWLWQRSFTDFCPAEVLMLCVCECVSVLYVQIQIGVWPRQTYVLQHILYFMCEICGIHSSFYMSAGGHLHKLFQHASGAGTVLWFVVIWTLRTSINGEGKLK